MQAQSGELLSTNLSTLAKTSEETPIIFLPNPKETNITALEWQLQMFMGQTINKTKMLSG